MTAADYAHAAIVATLVGFIATLVYAQHRREVCARRAMQARVRQIAADTWARHQRQVAANDIAREVTAAFDAARDPWHTTRADIEALPTTSEENR